MKPVYQEPDVPECYRCCIATIFELDKEDLPIFGLEEGADVQDEGIDAFIDGLKQQQEVEAWLKERGLFIQQSTKNDDGLMRPVSPWGVCIAWGDSPREHVHSHAVVCDFGDWKSAPHWRRDFEEALVHDPHPSGEGLAEVRGFDSFVVLDPVKAAARLTREMTA